MFFIDSIRVFITCKLKIKHTIELFMPDGGCVISPNNYSDKKDIFVPSIRLEVH